MALYGGWPAGFKFASDAASWVPKRAYRTRWKKSKKNSLSKMKKYKVGTKKYNKAEAKYTYFKSLLDKYKRKSRTGRPKGSRDKTKRKMKLKKLSSFFNQGKHIIFGDDVNTGIEGKVNWKEPTRDSSVIRAKWSKKK